jgi:hypothetical protein
MYSRDSLESHRLFKKLKRTGRLASPIISFQTFFRLGSSGIQMAPFTFP